MIWWLFQATAAPPRTRRSTCPWGYVEPVLEAFGLEPGGGASALLLNDPGPWGTAWSTFTVAEETREVLDRLEEWGDRDPRELFLELRERGGGGA